MKIGILLDFHFIGTNGDHIKQGREMQLIQSDSKNELSRLQSILSGKPLTIFLLVEEN